MTFPTIATYALAGSTASSTSPTSSTAAFSFSAGANQSVIAFTSLPTTETITTVELMSGATVVSALTGTPAPWTTTGLVGTTLQLLAYKFDNPAPGTYTVRFTRSGLATARWYSEAVVQLGGDTSLAQFHTFGLAAMVGTSGTDAPVITTSTVNNLILEFYSMVPKSAPTITPGGSQTQIGTTQGSGGGVKRDLMSYQTQAAAGAITSTFNWSDASGGNRSAALQIAIPLAGGVTLGDLTLSNSTVNTSASANAISGIGATIGTVGNSLGGIVTLTDTLGGKFQLTGDQYAGYQLCRTATSCAIGSYSVPYSVSLAGATNTPHTGAFSVSVVADTSYYIDPTAGSTGSGTIGSPFKYWNDITNWVPGVKILLKAGTILQRKEVALSYAGVTITDAGDLFTKAAHGYQNYDVVRFSSIVSTTGLSTSVDYYVMSATANTFQVRDVNQVGTGAAVLTTNGTATVTLARGAMAFAPGGAGLPGNTITLDSYGTGSKPLMSGAMTTTGWAPVASIDVGANAFAIAHGQKVDLGTSQVFGVCATQGGAMMFPSQWPATSDRMGLEQTDIDGPNYHWIDPVDIQHDDGTPDPTKALSWSLDGGGTTYTVTLDTSLITNLTKRAAMSLTTHYGAQSVLGYEVMFRHSGNWNQNKTITYHSGNVIKWTVPIGDPPYNGSGSNKVSFAIRWHPFDLNLYGQCAFLLNGSSLPQTLIGTFLSTGSADWGRTVYNGGLHVNQSHLTINNVALGQFAGQNTSHGDGGIWATAGDVCDYVTVTNCEIRDIYNTDRPAAMGLYFTLAPSGSARSWRVTDLNVKRCPQLSGVRRNGSGVVDFRHTGTILYMIGRTGDYQQAGVTYAIATGGNYSDICSFHGNGATTYSEVQYSTMTNITVMNNSTPMTSQELHTVPVPSKSCNWTKSIFTGRFNVSFAGSPTGYLTDYTARMDGGDTNTVIDQCIIAGGQNGVMCDNKGGKEDSTGFTVKRSVLHCITLGSDASFTCDSVVGSPNVTVSAGLATLKVGTRLNPGYGATTFPVSGTKIIGISGTTVTLDHNAALTTPGLVLKMKAGLEGMNFTDCLILRPDVGSNVSNLAAMAYYGATVTNCAFAASPTVFGSGNVMITTEMQDKLTSDLAGGHADVMLGATSLDWIVPSYGASLTQRDLVLTTQYLQYGQTGSLGSPCRSMPGEVVTLPSGIYDNDDFVLVYGTLFIVNPPTTANKTIQLRGTLGASVRNTTLTLPVETFASLTSAAAVIAAARRRQMIIS